MFLNAHLFYRFLLFHFKLLTFPVPDLQAQKITLSRGVNQLIGELYACVLKSTQHA